MLRKSNLLITLLFFLARGLILLAIAGAVASFLIFKSILLAIICLVGFTFAAGGAFALTVALDEDKQKAYKDIPGMNDWIQKVQKRIKNK